MQSTENESSIHFTGTFPRLGLTVGTKTWISLTLLFWIPFSILLSLLFLFLEGQRQEERVERLRHDLRFAKAMERRQLGDLHLRLADRPAALAGLFRDRNGPALQRALATISAEVGQAPILVAVDAQRRVLARLADRTAGDELRVGAVLTDALIRAEDKESLELVENAFLVREGVSVRRETGDQGIAGFVILPVRWGERVVGALVVGLPLTGSAEIPNRLLQEYDAELGVFAGHTPEGALLHSSSSLPRSIWTAGQTMPEPLKEPTYLNRSFAGHLELSGIRYLAVTEPIADSRGSVIGAFVVAHPLPLFEGGNLRRLLWAFLVGSFLGFVPAVVITYFVSRDIAGPVAAMTRGLHRFAGGDTGVRMFLATGDQFEEMGRGFNRMAEDISLREDRLRKHYEVAHLLMGSLRLDELLDRVLRIAIEVTQSVAGIIYLYNEEERTLIPEASWGIAADVKPLKQGEGIAGRSAVEKRSIVMDLSSAAGGSEETLPLPDLGMGPVTLREVAFIPFVYQERLLGVLVLGSMRGYESEDRRLFEYLATQIAIALDNALLHSKVHELSITDHLTGLYNRRYLHERMQTEWARSLRHNDPLAVILADVDNFKRINDELGHDRGDEVLSGVANLLQSLGRKEDLVSRFGGEEFIVVLPATNREGAVQLAERLRVGVEELRLLGAGQTVTISLGVACFPEYRPESFEELFWAADQAMYRAKSSGKNRVVVYEP